MLWMGTRLTRGTRYMATLSGVSAAKGSGSGSRKRCQRWGGLQASNAGGSSARQRSREPWLQQGVAAGSAAQSSQLGPSSCAIQGHNHNQEAKQSPGTEKTTFNQKQLPTRDNRQPRITTKKQQKERLPRATISNNHQGPQPTGNTLRTRRTHPGS